MGVLLSAIRDAVYRVFTICMYDPVSETLRAEGDVFFRVITRYVKEIICRGDCFIVVIIWGAKIINYFPPYQNPRFHLCCLSFKIWFSVKSGKSETLVFISACALFLIPGITVETASFVRANLRASSAMV